MADGFLAYQLHCAVVAHYHGEYDLFKYNAKTKVTEQTFSTHRMKWQYMGLEKELVKNKNALLWYYYVLNKKNSHKFLTKPFGLAHVKESFGALNKLIETWNVLHRLSESEIDELTSVHSIYPYCYELMLNNQLSYNDVLLLDRLRPFITTSVVSDPVSWPSFVKTAKKDVGFINIAVNHLASFGDGK